MDRHWNVLQTNGAADLFFGWLLGKGNARQRDPPDVRPGGIRPSAENWEAAADALVQRVHREAASEAEELGRTGDGPLDLIRSGDQAAVLQVQKPADIGDVSDERSVRQADLLLNAE